MKQEIGSLDEPAFHLVEPFVVENNHELAFLLLKAAKRNLLKFPVSVFCRVVALLVKEEEGSSVTNLVFMHFSSFLSLSKGSE